MRRSLESSLVCVLGFSLLLAAWASIIYVKRGQPPVYPVPVEQTHIASASDEVARLVGAGNAAMARGDAYAARLQYDMAIAAVRRSGDVQLQPLLPQLEAAIAGIDARYAAGSAGPTVPAAVADKMIAEAKKSALFDDLGD